MATINGQLRPISVRDRSVASEVAAAEKADTAKPGHVAAPFQGVVTMVVAEGDQVEAGDDRRDDRGDEDGGLDHRARRRDRRAARAHRHPGGRRRRPGAGAVLSEHEGTPVVAGIVAAIVGSSSSFVVVLAGLTAVGASPAQAASGLLTVLVSQALGMLWLALRHRTPITLAWSTPGAALLLSTGAVTGGWAAAVGAFVVTGLLIVLTGLVPALGDLIARIPTSLARAMLAGVLLPICLEPVIGLADSPAYVAPVVLAWLVMHRISRALGGAGLARGRPRRGHRDRRSTRSRPPT